MTLLLTSPEEARALATARWDRALRAWIRGEAPRLQVPIRGGSATERDILPDLSGYRNWLRGWADHPHVTWRTVSKGGLGSVRVPVEVSPPDLDTYADWVGARSSLDRVRARLRALERERADRVPLATVRWDLDDMGEEEFSTLLSLIRWRRGSPDPVRARDVPLAGVSTKWVESRMGLIEPVLAACGLLRPGSDRFERCGLIRGTAAQLSFRFSPGDFPVLEMTCEARNLVSWPVTVHTLLVVENKTNILRLRPPPGYAVAWGAGHAVEASFPDLEAAPGLRLLYWGDCDSHGYAILNALREELPHIISVGMGIDTLHAYRDAFIAEPEEARMTGTMPRLNASEGAGREHQLAHHARLEQELVHLPDEILFPPRDKA
ncbi:MAG: hypothetical protein KC466_19505 [Myxococcales bacterium]|nr:hypothetical protein [Myxococcales bacterium]